MLYQTNHVQVVKYHAYAKINLALRVLGRREDGYHEVSTLMVPVDISDLVYVEARPQGLEVICPELPGLAGHDNLAYRAAKSYFAFRDITGGFKISIQKSVPAAKGLGGGSSDAAAVLLAIRDLTGDRARLGPETLMDIASTIGSDVPFFVGANSKPPLWHGALCTGRGECIHPVEGGSYWIVLIFPEARIETKAAYARWDQLFPGESLISSKRDNSDCAVSLDLKLHKTIEAFASRDPERLGKSIFNDLEEPVCSSFPELTIIKENLLVSGACGAAMTGSGSAVFGICSSREHGLEVRDRFLGLSQGSSIRQAVVTRTGV
ncbi:MAG: 4-(cytidine 5'-diphospho)-2-C-methyl-D-erythritol kinase [Bacillota bacterium]